MKSKLNNFKDFWSGVMFVVVGAMFAGIASTYKYGTTTEMGAGYFPFWLGILLIVLGVGVAVGGVRAKGPVLDRFHWRPVLTVLVSVCIFGVLLKVLGMLAAGVLLVIGASFGSHEFKWREVVLLAAARKTRITTVAWRTILTPLIAAMNTCWPSLASFAAFEW
jgi:hypothetical protein